MNRQIRLGLAVLMCASVGPALAVPSVRAETSACVPALNAPCTFDDLVSQTVGDLLERGSSAVASASAIETQGPEAAARVDRRAITRQTEQSSAAANTTSLVDTTSASDLVSAALNFASLSLGEGDNNADSVSGTASLYALATAVAGSNPLDHKIYCKPGSRYERMVYFTFGYENEHDDSATDSTLVGSSADPAGGGTETSAQERPAILYGLKLRFSPHADFDLTPNGDACKVADEFLPRLRKSAEALHGDLVSVYTKVAENLAQRLRTSTPGLVGTAGVNDVLVAIRRQDVFREVLESIGGYDRVETLRHEVQADVLKEVQEDLARLNKEIEGYDGDVDEMIDRKTNGTNEWALTATAKDRSRGSDEYNFGLVTSYKVSERFLGTANGGARLVTEDGGTPSSQKGTAAIQADILLWQPTQADARPFKLTLALDGEWGNGKPALKAQAKTVLTDVLARLPFLKDARLSGIEVPVSITIANRTDLVEESEVRGQVGFTIDTSAIADALKGS